MDFNQVRQLEQIVVPHNSQWIYIADFNIDLTEDGLKSTDRLQDEREDLLQLLNSGARVVILAHNGRFKDKDTDHLDYIPKNLAEILGISKERIKYCQKNNNALSQIFADKLKPGEAAILGNTRQHQGEEENNPTLALQFARHGRYVAVGGFSKAHREQASNFGILDLRAGFATRSQLRDMKKLEPWAGKSDKYSVAILGGVKKEKIKTGLVGFSQIYDAIIPGGIVLNTLLKVKGYEIGDSIIRDGGKTFERDAKQVLQTSSAKILLPEIVAIARKTRSSFKSYQDINRIPITKGVPEGYSIVGYQFTQEMHDCLEKVIDENGRAIAAGTPGILGLDPATNAIQEKSPRLGNLLMALGGDTSAELGHSTYSSGGGSALYFIINKTTPVYEKLRENKEKFEVNF
jgi:phosphoglycerate kinase